MFLPLDAPLLTTDNLRYNVKYFPVLQFLSVFIVSCYELCCILRFLFFVWLCLSFCWLGFILESFYLPITSNSAAAINVWNEGASADTSQLYLPEVGIVTASSTTWLSLEAVRCKGKQNEKWWWESGPARNWRRESSAYKNEIHLFKNIQFTHTQMFVWVYVSLVYKNCNAHVSRGLLASSCYAFSIIMRRRPAKRKIGCKMLFKLVNLVRIWESACPFLAFFH